MSEKFVDPRLQAKETMFQQLHLSTFDTMAYANSIVQEVNSTGKDIPEQHEDYQQLIRDYEVTRNLSNIKETPLFELCEKTDQKLADKNAANATYAQLCAAATNSLNHWRILCEIPKDLLDNQAVTQSLKQNLNQHKQAWVQILDSI